MMGVSAQANRINLAIAIWQWPSYFKPEERMKGIRLDMAEYRRPDPRPRRRAPRPPDFT
jgi:branched-chain amino acid aminotransferase